MAVLAAEGAVDLEAKDRIIRQRKERHRKNTIVLWTVIVCLVVFVIIMFMILVRSGAVEKALNDGVDWIWRTLRLDTEDPVDEAQEASVPVEEIPGTEAWIMAHAEALARQYDYDGAMDLLKGEADYFRNQRYQDAVAGWQLIKDECVPWSATEVTHIYFLPLINDPSRAFDGDFHAESYNQDMATVTEFRRILDEMYQNGYVMVSLHDMCRVNADGSVSTKEILLPEGKKPFVLSQDDVNYYHQMSGDGFADLAAHDLDGNGCRDDPE